MRKMDFFVELALCKHVLHLLIAGQQLFPAAGIGQTLRTGSSIMKTRFGVLVHFEKIGDTYSRNGVTKRPESKPGGAETEMG